MSHVHPVNQVECFEPLVMITVGQVSIFEHSSYIYQILKKIICTSIPVLDFVETFILSYQPGPLY